MPWRARRAPRRRRGGTRRDRRPRGPRRLRRRAGTRWRRGAIVPGARAFARNGIPARDRRRRCVMSARGVLTCTRVEARKLLAQRQCPIVLALCAAAPFAFVAALRAQDGLPSDTLFGRLVHESGFAIPLVVLGFAGLWGLPIVAGLAGGDIFASED